MTVTNESLFPAGTVKVQTALDTSLIQPDTDVSIYVKNINLLKGVNEIWDAKIILDNKFNKFTTSSATIKQLAKGNWTQVELGINYTGASTGSNTTATLNDTSQSWTTNSLADCYISVNTSSGLEKHIIKSNTATQITIIDTWSSTPTTGAYRLSKNVLDGKIYDIDTDSLNAKNRISITVRGYLLETTKRNIICLNRKRSSETIKQMLIGSLGSTDGYGNYADGIMFKLRQTNPIYTNHTDQADTLDTVSNTGVLSNVIETYTFSESDTVFAGLLQLIEPLMSQIYVKRNKTSSNYYLDFYLRELATPSVSTTRHTLIYNATGAEKCILKNNLKKTYSEGDYNVITVRGARNNSILGIYDGRTLSTDEIIEKTITYEQITNDTLANLVAEKIYTQDHAERLEGSLTCEGIRTFMIEPGDVCTIYDPDSGFDNTYAVVKRIKHIYIDDSDGMKYTTEIEFDKGMYRTGKVLSDLLLAQATTSRFRNDNELIDDCIILEKDSIATTENLNVDFSPYSITVTGSGGGVGTIDVSWTAASINSSTAGTIASALTGSSNETQQTVVYKIYYGTTYPTALGYQGFTDITVNSCQFTGIAAGTYQVWMKTFFTKGGEVESEVKTGIVVA